VRYIILAACLFFCGCVQTKTDKASQGMLVREETRKGTEAGQKTDMKIVTREVTESQASEATKTEVDVEAIVTKAMNAAMAGVNAVLGDYKASMDRFMSVMTAPKQEAGMDGTTVGGLVTAGLTLAGVAVQKHMSSKSKSKELRDKNAELVELAKRLPPEPQSKG